MTRSNDFPLGASSEQKTPPFRPPTDLTTSPVVFVSGYPICSVQRNSPTPLIILRVPPLPPASPPLPAERNTAGCPPCKQGVEKGLPAVGSPPLPQKSWLRPRFSFFFVFLVEVPLGLLSSLGFPPSGGGAVAVLGSRSLPSSALRFVFLFSRALASRGWSLWSGGALGADSAALSGALSVGGFARVFLPASVSSVPLGSGSLPWSSPRRLVSSLPLRSVSSFASGLRGSFSSRLLSRSRVLLSSLPSGSSVVVFVSSASWLARRGGSFASVRFALRLGFVPGVSLFVFLVSPSGRFSPASFS